MPSHDVIDHTGNRAENRRKHNPSNHGGLAQDMPEQGAVPDDEGSIGHMIERLVDAGKELANAELALVRTRAALIGGSARWIAVLGVIAFITAFGMIVTLMIGAVLALAPLWGLGLALLAVTGLAVLVIVLCGLGIKGQVARIKGVVK